VDVHFGAVDDLAAEVVVHLFGTDTCKLLVRKKVVHVEGRNVTLVVELREPVDGVAVGVSGDRLEESRAATGFELERL
jgi:hypothetical protein